jgi:hypothetical protein
MPEVTHLLLSQGYATVQDCEDLAHESFRLQIAQQAASWGATVSWDPRRSTMAMFLAPEEDHYPPAQRAALLLAYINLRVRATAATDNSAPLSITGAGFAAAFPNVFPDAPRANQALRALADISFLRAVGDAYIEGPLLGHAFPMEQVQEFLNGEMAGLFDSLKPAEPAGGDLRHRILQTLALLEGNKATKPTLLARIDAPWADIKKVLDQLSDEDLVKAEGYAEGRHHILTKEGAKHV